MNVCFEMSTTTIDMYIDDMCSATADKYPN